MKQLLVLDGPPITIVREPDKGFPSNVFGYYDPTNRVIYIHKLVTGDDFWAVLLHEVMHICELQLEANGEISEGDSDRHKFITGSSDLLTQLYFLNKRELFKENSNGK